jgi:predicted RecB family nuclease
MPARKHARVCPNGHRYEKTSDCPTCPICEAQRKPEHGLLSTLSAPARRALERLGIASAKDLSKHTEAEILALHGMGPGSLPKLRRALADEGLDFRKT